MSDISIEKRMEINADIRTGCVDVAKIVESMARKRESVEVITQGILRPVQLSD